MWVPSRKICLTILLTLAVSQVSLALHAASHNSADHSVCQLCNGFDNTAHAIPSSTSVIHQSCSQIELIEPELPVVTISIHSPYHQRAPPKIV